LLFSLPYRDAIHSIKMNFAGRWDNFPVLLDIPFIKKEMVMLLAEIYNQVWSEDLSI